MRKMSENGERIIRIKQNRKIDSHEPDIIIGKKLHYL
jgi:hypothetical protein